MIRARMRRLRSGEGGYTLIELVVVMAILGVVMTGLTTIFVSGSSAELDMNRRFQAQQQARLALDKIRGDIHCASAALATTINTYQALELNTTKCHPSSTTPAPSTYDYWCVVPVTTTPVRYALYRSESNAAATSTTCTASDAARLLVADYLISNTAFSVPSIPKYALETVAVDFKVNVNPSVTHDVYELSDSIVARNYVYDSTTPIIYCNLTTCTPTFP